MNFNILDKENNKKSIEIHAFGEFLVSSGLDKTLRFYLNNNIEHIIELGNIAIKLSSFNNTLIALTLCGKIIFIDKGIRIIKQELALQLPNNLICFDNILLYSTWNKFLVIQPIFNNLEIIQNVENLENEKFINKAIKACSKNITCLAASKNNFVVGLENTIKIFNHDLNEILSKDFTSVINSIEIVDNGVFTALLDGRIAFNHFEGNEKSFIFNAHCINSANERMFHSVNTLAYNEFLYSGGSDGKIKKWNVEKMVLESILFECQSNIKKICLKGKILYAILEDLKTEIYNEIIYLEV